MQNFGVFGFCISSTFAMFSMTNLYFCEACFTGQYSILLCFHWIILKLFVNVLITELVINFFYIIFDYGYRIIAMVSLYELLRFPPPILILVSFLLLLAFWFQVILEVGLHCCLRNKT